MSSKNFRLGRYLLEACDQGDFVHAAVYSNFNSGTLSWNFTTLGSCAQTPDLMASCRRTSITLEKRRNPARTSGSSRYCASGAQPYSRTGGEFIFHAELCHSHNAVGGNVHIQSGRATRSALASMIASQHVLAANGLNLALEMQGSTFESAKLSEQQLFPFRELKDSPFQPRSVD